MQDALERHDGILARAAAELGITRQALWAKVRRLGLGRRGPRERCYPRRPSREGGRGERERRAAPGRERACARSSGSWRLLSVVLLSFSSGLPLGLVWLAIPAWMARAGVDIKVIGLFTLAQAPWSFKLLWSPLMDRFPPPFLGRKRGWILIGQVALFALTLWLAGVSNRPEAVWVIGALALAIAFASATQDIAIDAYAVEVLRRDEQGFATRARAPRSTAPRCWSRAGPRSPSPPRPRGRS